MDKKTKGAWLVYQTGKLQRVENQGTFENTYLAGKAAILLSAISTESQSQITDAKLQALARGSGINSKTELPVVLKTLQDHQLIDIASSSIEVLGVTTAATLAHGADIFDSLGPSNTERAAIDLSERASERPEEKKGDG